MKEEIKFLALGGAQSIGASCYLLKLGNNNILLDCGTVSVHGLIRGPNFLPLYTEGQLHSIKELSAVFITHAHLDHMGYLPQLLAEHPELPVYMTEITEMLVRYQLFDNKGVDFKLRASKESTMVANSLLDNIHIVNYFERINLGNCSAMFLQAGHIPGAMMVMFNYKGRNILYTGDYSFQDTLLTHGCMAPSNIKIDILILCGTHAKHSWYKREDNGLTRGVMKIINLVRSGRNVFCKINQLSKGVEVLAEVNRVKELYRLKIPVYIDEAIMEIVQNLERAHVGILKAGNNLLRFGSKLAPHITIVQDNDMQPESDETVVKVDFALHDDFKEMTEFIKCINPNKAVIVHCGIADEAISNTVEDGLIWDPTCMTQFYFPEEGQLLQL